MVRLGVDLAFLTVRCADGRWIQMCARQDAHFRNWVRAVGLGHMLDEPAYINAPLAIRSPEDVQTLEERLRAQMATP